MKSNNQVMQLQRCFIYAAVILLTLTAIGKVLSVLGSTPILNRANPLFAPLTNRHMMFAAAVAELAVAYLAFRYRQDTVALTLIGCLSAAFLVYRIGLFVIGYDAPCDCLGAFTEAISIPPSTANTIAKSILGFLLIGSWGLLCARNASSMKSVDDLSAQDAT